MINDFINNNYKELVSIARTAIFKSGKNYRPEELISLLYLHLLETKDINNLMHYSIRYIYQSVSWTNSEIAKDNRCKEVLEEAECVIEEADNRYISLDCLNKYEQTLYKLYYVEDLTIQQIIDTLKVKLTYAMVWRDVEKIRNKLKKEWHLLNS